MRYRPDQRIRVQQERLGRVTQRLQYAMQRQLSERTAALRTQQEKLSALDPLLILQRGYAAVYREDGRVLSSVGQTSAGDTIRIQLADGSIRAVVEETHEL